MVVCLLVACLAGCSGNRPIGVVKKGFEAIQGLKIKDMKLYFTDLAIRSFAGVESLIVQAEAGSEMADKTLDYVKEILGRAQIEIQDETIEGDEATVVISVLVMDMTGALRDAISTEIGQMYLNNPNMSEQELHVKIMERILETLKEWPMTLPRMHTLKLKMVEEEWRIDTPFIDLEAIINVENFGLMDAINNPMFDNPVVTPDAAE